MTDTTIGTGEEAVAGEVISVHDTGWLFDQGTQDQKGRKFDGSRDHGNPFTFERGARQVLHGWDNGFAGVEIGGQRTLVIPPEQGYGARGAGGVIPPNAPLLFEVKLLAAG